MPRYVQLTCVVCGSGFEKQYKLRHHQTCSRECSYKLRIQTRKKVHEPVTKTCDRCNEEFEDTSKKKQVTTCWTCVSEKMVETRRTNGSYERTEEQNQQLSMTLRKKYEEGWNPHTDEWRKAISESSKANWACPEYRKKMRKTALEKYGVEHHMKSPKYRQMASERGKGWNPSDETRRKMSTSAARRVRENRNLLTRGIGGIREDIGHYVRSRWEANFARTLLTEGKEYEYEPKTFEFPCGTTYTPDFKVDDMYYEVKGWWTAKARKKVELFREHYPDIELKIVGPDEYNELEAKYSELENWEHK